MPGLIAYGSLMSVAELNRQRFPSIDPAPITVTGFRRSFSQEPSWRQGSGKHRGVLTVAMNAEASFNAILISKVSESDLTTLDHRERGYDRVSVQPSLIRAFGGGQRISDQDEAFLYIGKRERFNSDLKPNADYLNLCVTAARDWGQEFRAAFLRSTFVSETQLIEYDWNSRPDH